MAMKTVSLIVRAFVEGKRRNLSPEEAKQLGLAGTFYMRWEEDGKDVWRSVGKDGSAARMAAIRKEREFRGLSSIQAEITLVDAIETYLGGVRTSNGEKAYKRARWLLDLFAKVVKVTYLHEITSDVLISFMTYLKDNGKSPKTMRDRVGSIQTFLQARGMKKLEIKLPKVTKKLVDCYTENEINRMLAVADEDERFLILFLLATGVREQEAAHMTWSDVKLEAHEIHVTAK
jgi:integrase